MRSLHGSPTSLALDVQRLTLILRERFANLRDPLDLHRCKTTKFKTVDLAAMPPYQRRDPAAGNRFQLDDVAHDQSFGHQSGHATFADLNADSPYGGSAFNLNRNRSAEAIAIMPASVRNAQRHLIGSGPSLHKAPLCCYHRQLLRSL